MEVREGLDRKIPVFLKIAPDLSEAEIAEIAEVAIETGISGIIATNTTLSRDGLKSPHRDEMGGLSGAPVFEKSTRVLAQLSKLTDGKLPLIGVGGVSNAKEAYTKIKAGASAVQLYTALVYGGMGLVKDIVTGLETLLEKDGFANVSEAVGTGREDWL
jgi:dihydroorotate dehydrogenase